MGNINFKARTIFCRDNLDVLRGINSACIDLIYLDPPFNKNKVFTAPIGSSAEGAEFSDIFREEDVKDEWVKSIEYENAELHSYLAGVKTFGNKYNYCYLAYMAIRLIECRRVLKDTGSVYLHCDPTMSHYLKIVLDCIFGEKNFRNEVVWNYGKWSNVSKFFQRNHDIILFYGKTAACKFKPLMVGKRASQPYHTNIINGKGQLLIYDKDAVDAGIVRKYEAKGYKIVHVKSQKVAENDTWTFLRDGRLNILNSQSKERTGYPTQKPLALLERIISASSGEGGMVLDPFCGCATTCVAAEKLGRQWAGVDISQTAYELVNKRLKTLYREQSEGSITHPLLLGKYSRAHFTTTPPKRDKNAREAERGFVYVISHRAYPGEWKVGIAKDPVKRAQSYQTADPRRGYHLEKAFPTPYYREVERAVHAHFNADNEWVKAKSVNVVIAAIKRIIAKKGGALT